MLPIPRGRRQERPRGRLRERLQRIAFALLYGRGALLYDRFTDWLFLGEWARWQETALPPLPSSGLVVELGAGTGRLAAIAARRGRRWIALDPSPSMVAAAGRRIFGTGTGTWVVRASARSIPIADDAADAVVATFPSPFIRDVAVQAEVARVLAPGGCLVVVLNGALAPDGWRRSVRGRALRLFYGTGEAESPAAFRVDGIRGRTSAVRTLHGTATRYVGTLPIPRPTEDGEPAAP